MPVFCAQRDRPAAALWIGDAALAEHAYVEWPGSEKEMFHDFKANQLVVLEEGRGTKAP
jgi:hypothetical protein